MTPGRPGAAAAPHTLLAPRHPRCPLRSRQLPPRFLCCHRATSCGRLRNSVTSHQGWFWQMSAWTRTHRSCRTANGDWTALEVDKCCSTQALQMHRQKRTEHAYLCCAPAVLASTCAASLATRPSDAERGRLASKRRRNPAKGDSGSVMLALHALRSPHRPLPDRLSCTHQLSQL
jgi:hypothetical protein